MYLCMYPSSAHSFGPISMKLGMDIPWDPGSVIGQVASAKRKARGSEATEKRKPENASAKREARGSEATEKRKREARARSAKPDGAK